MGIRGAPRIRIIRQGADGKSIAPAVVAPRPKLSFEDRLSLKNITLENLRRSTSIPLDPRTWERLQLRSLAGLRQVYGDELNNELWRIEKIPTAIFETPDISLAVGAFAGNGDGIHLILGVSERFELDVPNSMVFQLDPAEPSQLVIGSDINDRAHLDFQPEDAKLVRKMLVYLLDQHQTMTPKTDTEQ
jgi:hypothetical protein